MATGEWYKDYNAIQRHTPAGSGGQAWAAYLKAKGATSEGYGNAFKELDIAARQEGVTVNRPVLASNMSQAQYQEVLSQYLANINNEVLKKNVTNALKDVQKQGMQAGVNVGLPTLANLNNANADSLINNYINTVNQRIYINYATTAVNDLHSQGLSNGVNVAIPAISNNISQAQAQEIVNRYQSQVNSALLVKSTQDALQNVRSQAVSYGVNVAVPAISAGITEQAANALIDKYVSDVNAKLSSATVSESKPASNNQIQTSSKVNNALVGSTVTAPSVSISRNSDGSLAVNEGLYNQLKAAQTQYKSWWNDYSGIPQQVIDSQATDVRINSKGQFEWTPVTAADKAQLDKINVQRTRSGLAPRTTLIHGPEKSNEYNTKWLSTTGSGSRGVGESGVKIKDASGKTVKSYDYNTANLAKVGSGDIKIASVKAGSSVNANATAKTNTAQSVKATKITQKELNAKLAAAHPGQIQLKDGSWINQVQGSQGIKESVKIISAVKSLEEADKLYQQKLAGNYNPTVGTVTNEYMKAKHDKYIADVKAAKALAAEIEKTFKPILDAREKIVNPITVKGSFGTGEANVTYKSGKYEKTAKAYQSELRAAQKNAKISITNKTSAKDKKIILAARSYLESHNINADLTGAAFAGKKAVQFKTVDQLNYEKALKSDLPLFALSAKLNKQLTEALSYKNVTSKVGKKAEEANKAVSEYLDLPSLAEIEKERDALIPDIRGKVTQPGKATREHSLKSKHRDVQKAIYGDKYGEALFDTTYNTLESARKKPVTSAATVAAIYASGAIAGVAIEGGLGAVAAGAGRVALGAGKTAKAAGYVSKYTPTVGHTALGAYVGAEGVKTVMSGDAQKTVNFVASLAVGGMGYSKGARIVKDPVSIIPNVRTVKIQEVTAGHGTTVKDITVGETFSVGGKSVISRNANGGFVKGAPSLPIEMSKTLNSKGKLDTRIIQAFNKADNAAFEATAKRWSGETDALLFRSGKKISDVAYGLSKPVTTPKKFEVTSEHVPLEMKSIVKDTIVAFGKARSQGIEVYGSVAQKAQMKGYLSRIPQDIEVSVTSTDKFIALFKTKAVKAGFKEGVDFRITKAEADAPKIEFKIDGKWEKGVEVFSSKSGVTKEMPGYRSEDGIAFGYKKLKSLNVENVKIMKLQEQAARKHAGATTLQGGEIKPVHPGRAKDVRDLIEIGVANEVTFKTGISKEIIQYAKLYAAKNPSVKESPVAGYLINNGKMPTKPEFNVLTSGTLKKSEMQHIITRMEDLSLKDLDDILRAYKVVQDNFAIKQVPKMPNPSYRALRQARGQNTPIAANKSRSQVKNTVKKDLPAARFRQSVKSKAIEKDLLFVSKSKATGLRDLKGLADVSKALGSKVLGSKAVSSKVLGFKDISISKAKGKAVSKAMKSKAITKPSKAVSLKVKPSKTVPSKAVTSKSKPSKSIPSKIIPSKATTSKAVPSRAIPSKSAPSKATSSRAIPSKSIETKKLSKKIPVSKNAGSQSVTSRYARKKKTPAQIRGKKAANKLARRDNDRKHLQRKIRNTLGSMKSIFG